MASVDIERVGKAYGPYRILQGLDFAIKDGEFLVLVGSYSCGCADRGLDHGTAATVAWPIHRSLPATAACPSLRIRNGSAYRLMGGHEIEDIAVVLAQRLRSAFRG